MNCRARMVLLTSLLGVFLGKVAPAQVVIQPTPHPTVTAENERWYLNGEPITHAGSLYYPAGPQVYFNANEMVRSGFFMGLPLYSRTTIEPYSVVYIPVGPALMQPYERPRTGPLAQTEGSLASSLLPMTGGDVVGTSGLQAAGPPSLTTTVIPVHVPPPVATSGALASQFEPEPALAPVGLSTPARRPTHTSIGGRPQGSNSVFIEFEGSRWYKAGAAEPIDTANLRRVGTYSGIPVWAKQAAADGIIYIPVTQGGGSLAVPYSRRR